MKAIEVGGNFLQLPSDIFDVGERKGTIIDSGTTLAYLPEAAYKPLIAAVRFAHRHLIFDVDNIFFSTCCMCRSHRPSRI